MSFQPCHLLVSILKAVRAGLYLSMQLLSTALVVPMLQSCAQSVDCIREPGVPVSKIFQGNPDDEIWLSSAPHVQCWKGAHLNLFFVLSAIIPSYLFILIPYAVVSGDAHYVPRACLYEFAFWRKENAWRMAAARKATDLHMAFLHVNPTEAFRTLLFELAGKIFLPIVTTLTTERPMLQMVLVSLTGFTLWINSLFHAPYVERKFCVLIQDLKFFTFCTMLCGVITVWLHDPDSYIPVVLLVACGVAVLVTMTVQICVMPSSRPFVHVFAPASKEVADEEFPLLGEAAEPEPAAEEENAEEPVEAADE